MNESLREDRAEIETKMDLALEQFFNNVLECIVIDSKEHVFKI